MLPPIYTMNNNPVHVQKAGAVRQDMGCCGIQSSVPMLPDYGSDAGIQVLSDRSPTTKPQQASPIRKSVNDLSKVIVRHRTSLLFLGLVGIFVIRKSKGK